MARSGVPQGKEGTSNLGLGELERGIRRGTRGLMSGGVGTTDGSESDEGGLGGETGGLSPERSCGNTHGDGNSAGKDLSVHDENESD